MPTLPNSGYIHVYSLLEFLDTISEHLLMIGCQVSVEAPYDPLLRFDRERSEIRVSLEFLLPANIAEEHGFSERKGLPAPRQEIE